MSYGLVNKLSFENQWLTFIILYLTLLMKSYVTVSLLIFILALLPIASSAFCSSICSVDYDAGTAVCLNSSMIACVACKAPYLYNGTSFLCELPTRVVAFSKQLLMDTNFAMAGFSSSKPLTNKLCTYYFAGPYVKDDYLYKAYSGLGINHYQVNIYYSFALFGTWANNSISTIITDGNGVQNTNSAQGQQCPVGTVSGLGCPLSGCFKSYNLLIPHNTDFLSLNFTAAGSSMSTNPAIMFWGVKDLILVLSYCDPTCQTCTGPTNTTCTSCITGLFLQGSVCIITCPFYTMPSTGQCVMSCPNYYFLNTLNNYCELCPNGCPTCTATDQCASWDANANPANLFYDKIALWIILMVLGMVLIGILLWKFCLSTKSFYNSMEEEVIDHRPVEREQKITQINQSNQQMEPHWIEDIDDLHMTKVDVKKSKATGDSIQGIGANLNKVK